MENLKLRCEGTLQPVESLREHPKNANRHPVEQIARLASILKYQGFRSPIVVSNLSGCIVAGHGRLQAAILNGWPSVPVVYQDFENEDQELAHLHADNLISRWSDIDLSIINSQIGEFGPDFSIDMLGIENFTIEPGELPDLSTADRNPLRQMSFQVTEDQEEQIGRAIDLAKDMGAFGETGSSNSNGNALARIAEIFVTQNGSGKEH